MWKLAQAQHWLVTTSQLNGLGVTRSAIAHLVRTNRLWRVHMGVYVVGRSQLSREGIWLAAVLACGKGAALADLHAAALWDVWEGPVPRRPSVCVPSDNGRRGPRGVDLHRRATLGENDIIERNAIAVTTLERTLIDVARLLDDKRLRSVLRQSERVHRLDLQRMRDSLDAHPRNAAGPARLRRVIDLYVPATASTESDREAAFLELCARHAIPLPQSQVPVGPYRVDFMWPELHLVAELDDRQSHDGYVAFREDRVRDRFVKAAGFDTLRFTVTEVLRSGTAVARELKIEIDRRARGD